MTEQEQNIAVAEKIMGWPHVRVEPQDRDDFKEALRSGEAVVSFGVSSHQFHPRGESLLFTRSYDACAEMRNLLAAMGHHDGFTEELKKIVWITTLDKISYSIFGLINAIPAQQVEAGLRCMGLWREEGK